MSISLPLPSQRAAAPPVVSDERGATLTTRVTRAWERVTLLGILALSSVLELWQLNMLGTPNTFYAAAVLSMTRSLHAFLFNSLDSVGFVTIDKPPLGFWMQAASAKLLGFSGFSILLPEALATIGSVALLYHLVKRAFGGVAGLLAALMLALVPVSVVVGRNNTIDALLVCTLLLAVWTGLHATQHGSWKWLVATGALVGLGFEIKMLEAYLVVPALGLVYLLGAPVSRRRRVAHLVVASGVMLAVSLAWPLAVDLTPANLRPWMDSTQDNSAISLALGYNGIARLIGERQSFSQFLSGLGLRLSASDAAGAPGGGFAGGGMFNNGPAGALRLFDQQLGGQASWVLPLALVAIGLAVWQLISNGRGFVSSRRGQTTIVFGAWLLTAGAFFSVANFFHSYYLVTLGPPIAALAAVGVWGGWRQFRPSSPGVRILPLALIGTALVQAVLLGYYPTWSHWLSPIVIGGTALGCLGLVYGLVRASSSPSHSRVVMRAGAGLALAALLVVPAVWSGYSTLYSSRSGLPTAGPPVAGDRGLGFDPGPGAGGPVGPGGGRGFGGPGGIANPGGPAPGGFGGPDASLGSDLLDYLEANRGTATYLVATPDSNTAASIILASGGQPVMSLGGFSGSDPILTVDQFASMVRSGQVRFVLVAGRGGPQRSGTGSIMQWVEANGTPVPTTTMGASGSRQTQSQLYDLGRLQGVSA